MSSYIFANWKMEPTWYPLMELKVFGKTGLEEVRDWVETWGGVAKRKGTEPSLNQSKSFWDILRSVVYLKKVQQTENGTNSIRRDETPE